MDGGFNYVIVFSLFNTIIKNNRERDLFNNSRSKAIQNKIILEERTLLKKITLSTIDTRNYRYIVSENNDGQTRENKRDMISTRVITK